MYDRVLYTECPVSCQCGEKCCNQRIQRREWLSRSLEKFITDDRGFGVRTTQAIAAGMITHSLMRILTITYFSKLNLFDVLWAQLNLSGQ